MVAVSWREALSWCHNQTLHQAGWALGWANVAAALPPPKAPWLGLALSLCLKSNLPQPGLSPKASEPCHPHPKEQGPSWLAPGATRSGPACLCCPPYPLPPATWAHGFQGLLPPTLLRALKGLGPQSPFRGLPMPPMPHPHLLALFCR